jgi:heterodisulfide reductase subunit D
MAAINESHASTVVTTCPECYRTLKTDYAELLGQPKFEVLHASEFLAGLIDQDKIKFPGKTPMKVTYQDPCRLGRHMGVFDSPRKVITSIPLPLCQRTLPFYRFKTQYDFSYCRCPSLKVY